MEWSISNQILTVAVGSLGGGLTHLQKGGMEYLWQGDPAFWTGQAPHLFPIVGRLTGGKATVEGEPCSLGGHGFFRKREAALVEKTTDSLTVEEVWDEETYAQYPRKWRVALTYRLEKNTVFITFHVENLDEKTLWFYYGGHPGFRMPLEDGLDFCDYRLKFSEPCAPKQMTLSDDFFMTGDAVPFPTENGEIRLRHSLFDRDAVVLTDVAKSVTLYAPGSDRSVTVSYPQMTYLGLWHTPKTRAPFLCLEPWVDVPARQGVVEEISKKPHAIAVLPGASYENTWSITLT